MKNTFLVSALAVTSLVTLGSAQALDLFSDAQGSAYVKGELAGGFQNTQVNASQVVQDQAKDTNNQVAGAYAKGTGLALRLRLALGGSYQFANGAFAGSYLRLQSQYTSSEKQVAANFDLTTGTALYQNNTPLTAEQLKTAALARNAAAETENELRPSIESARVWVGSKTLGTFTVSGKTNFSAVSEDTFTFGQRLEVNSPLFAGKDYSDAAQASTGKNAVEASGYTLTYETPLLVGTQLAVSFQPGDESNATTKANRHTYMLRVTQYLPPAHKLSFLAVYSPRQSQVLGSVVSRGLEVNYATRDLLVQGLGLRAGVTLFEGNKLELTPVPTAIQTAATAAGHSVPQALPKYTTHRGVGLNVGFGYTGFNYIQPYAALGYKVVKDVVPETPVATLNVNTVTPTLARGVEKQEKELEALVGVGSEVFDLQGIKLAVFGELKFTQTDTVYYVPVGSTGVPFSATNPQPAPYTYNNLQAVHTIKRDTSVAAGLRLSF